MAKKIRVGILCGGQSAEHEISLLSAQNIVAAIDKRKYELVLIGIDKDVSWYLLKDPSHFLIHPDNPKQVRLNKSQERVTLVPGKQSAQLAHLFNRNQTEPLDVIFPVLHGTLGEDGAVQGFLKLANIAFVGAGVLGSALGMAKDFTKRLLGAAGISTAPFMVYGRHELDAIDFNQVSRHLGLPLFVKPASLGSSIGVSKVKDRKQFYAALKKAFEYDSRILIEEFIRGRELECSVLGNENPIASLPGELICRHEFYSYEAKYIDRQGAQLKIPANLPKSLVKRIQDLAVKTFKILRCEGMARVDFFLRAEKEIFVNELNTIPGFTKISMYPKLWQASGIPQTQLIDRLITLALERFQKEKKLKTFYV